MAHPRPADPAAARAHDARLAAEARAFVRRAYGWDGGARGILDRSAAAQRARANWVKRRERAARVAQLGAFA